MTNEDIVHHLMRLMDDVERKGKRLIFINYLLLTLVVILIIVKAVVGLRVSEEEELKGLDLAEHSMEAYADFSTRS